MATVSDKMVKEYVLMSRRVYEEHGKHVVPVVQCGKFFEVYDVRSAEASHLLGLCERLLYLKVTRKQKVTVEIASSEEACLVGTDGEGLPAVGEKHVVYCAGFRVDSAKKYRDILIERGYSLLPVVQNGGDNGRTVCTIESAGTHTTEGSSGVVFMTEDALHVARYDANLNAISMVERERPTDLHAALEDARSIVSELGGCSELEVHADESDAVLRLAVRGAFVGRGSTYVRALGKRLKFLCDRRWLRRALETHYTWITRLGDDVIAKLGMQDASVHHIATLVLLVGFLKDHDAQIGETLPVPNVRSNEGAARFLNGLPMLHVFDAPVPNGSLFHILGEHIHTAMGKRALRERLATPSVDVDAIRTKLLDIRRGLRVVEEAPDVEAGLRGMRDMEHLSCKVGRGRLVAADISKLMDAHARADLILALLPDSALRPADEHALALWQLLEYIRATFDADDPVDIFIKDDTAPTAVLAARKRLASAEETARGLSERYNELVSRHGATHHTSFQVNNGQTDLVVLSSIGARLKGAADCKVRPYSKDHCAIDDDDTRAVLCEWDAARTHLRQVHETAFAGACAHMRGVYFDAHSRAIARAIGNLDMLRGLALFFEKANYHAPELRHAPESGIVASALRHPLGERLVDQRGLAYVPNDVCLGPDESWLVYGVNSAGKSSLLKAIAIAVLMAQCGLYVAAATMSIAPYETVALHVGGSDDIFRHQSTFVKELEQLRCVLRASNGHGPRLLFLADELGNSTEDASAVKLVSSLMHTLVHRRTTAALATHMFALQSNPFVQGLTALKNKHLAVSFEADDAVVFERKLRDGLPDTRDYGCRIACLLLREDGGMVNAMRSDYHTARVDRALTGASRYNREAISQTCDICGHHPTERERPLQWHHIDEQHEADPYGRLQSGLNVHARVNLARVCESCHHRLHHGSLVIEHVRDTDRGRTLVVADDTEN